LRRGLCLFLYVKTAKTTTLSASRPSVVIQLVLPNLPAQCIPVNSQNLCCAALIAFRTLQHAFDKALLKFSHGLVKQDSPLHHLRNQSFQLVSHDVTLRIGLRSQKNSQSNSRPTRMRYASRYFARVAATTTAGNSGPGGVFGQRICSR